MQIEPYRRGRRRPDATGAKLDPRGFAAALALERGFVVLPEGVAIPLRRGKGCAHEFALVSYEDRHLGRFYWSKNNWSYPRRRDKTGAGIIMHREVMGLKAGDAGTVDHVNRDRFDNRRSNLRIITQAQNAQNQGARRTSTSKFRGVSLHKASGMWVVMHTLDGEPRYGGRYADEAEADAAAKAWRAIHMPYATG